MSNDFNNLTDHFGLASASLVLVASNDGKTRNITDVVHFGPIDAEEVGADVFNPVCVYEVVGDVNLSVVLGSMATSLSAFVTAVEVKTRAGESPKVTVRGTANEGAAAINLFPFACAVSRRHRAQNLLSAVDSVSSATEVTAVASVDPVVLWEAGAPCASDVVKGRVQVSVSHYGTTPTASSGWTRTSAPTNQRAKEFDAASAEFVKALALSAA